MRRQKDNYRRRNYGVVPLESQRPFMTQGKYASMRRLPRESPQQYLLGQKEYSRGTLANRISKVRKDVKNWDLWQNSTGATDPVEPFWSAGANGLLPIQPTGTLCSLGTLVNIPQGVGETQREGRQALITSLIVRGTIKLVPCTQAIGAGWTLPQQELQDAIPVMVRIWLVLDKQANGEAPALTDLLAEYPTNSDPTNLNEVNVMQNLNNIQRFVVLQDKTYNVSLSGYNGNFASGRPMQNERTFVMQHKCEIPIEYASTTGLINEIRANNIFLIAFSDNFPGTNPSAEQSQVYIKCNSRAIFLG